MRYPKASVVMALFVLAMTVARGAEGWKPLFNGKDLSGWDTWLAKPHPSVDVPGEAKNEKGEYTQVLGAKDPLNVFTIVAVDGQPAVRISGQIFGGITTKENFSNYHLRLQFKWGEKKWAPREAVVRDSGLLYHVHSGWAPVRDIWPRSPELQIQEHDCGDLYAIASQITVRAKRLDPAKRQFQYDPKGEPTVFIQQPPIGNKCIKGEDREKPNGEWNTIELVCLGDQSIHIVNGGVVMRLTDARRIDGPEPKMLTSGQIVLQSEGAEIFYRNIELRPITAIPAEFAEK
ncbi:MAG TPA: DUF1080 domain-containing protein [Opitutaceae bacterium]|nr:DUF1080 domain-containing protein [Opitutaceae bacterium]